MSAHTFLATTGRGLARATQTGDAKWVVDLLLADQDVRCIAANPLHKNLLYAGTQGSGVLRSNDLGRTWSPVGLANYSIKALAVSPHQPEIIYAGTKPALMFVSEDSGTTWTGLTAFRRIRRWFWLSPAEPPSSAYVQSIAVPPT